MAFVNNVDIINISGVPSVQTSGTNTVLGSVAVSNFPTTQGVSISGTPSANVFVQSGNAWAGVGSVQVANTVTTQPLIGSLYGIGVGSVYATVGNIGAPGSIYGIGLGSVAVAVISPATIGSLATQGVLGSVAITTSLLSVSGPGQLYGMGSGTTAWNPVMIESGAAGTPQRVVTAASLSAAAVYVPSGNMFALASGTSTYVPLMAESGPAGTPQRLIVAASLSAANVFVQSGNAWAGVGSVLVTGSVNIAGTPAVTQTGSVAITSSATLPVSGNSFGIYGMGSGTTAYNPLMIESGAAGAPQRLFTYMPTAWGGIGSVLTTGSVNIAGTPSVQPLIGSLYGIGIGSVAVSVISPATIGSLATQGIIGSVAVTNTPLVQGDAGHDAADTGSPLKIGFVATSGNITRVANNDRVNGYADLAGRQVVVLNHIREMTAQAGSDAVLTASGTKVLVLQSGGTGVYHDLTAIHITNGGSGATRVDFFSSGVAFRQFQIAAYGGAVMHLISPIQQPQANAAWEATLDTAVNRDVRIWVQAVRNI